MALSANLAYQLLMVLTFVENRCAMKRVLFAVFLVVASGTGAAAGPIEDADSAYQRGDYALAAGLYRPLAEQGNAEAQRLLGVIYYAGQGVPQDYQEAAKWYRKAAKQGNADAQLSLGVMYRNGQGVSHDFVRSYMWLNLAATAVRGDLKKYAMKSLDTVAPHMTAAQIVKAQEMSRRCQQSKFKECD
jgi:uncharacterized protein